MSRGPVCARSICVRLIRCVPVTYAINSNDRHIAALKNDITSPGGTTAAALYAAERGGFRTVISDTVWAAYRRSLELGGKSSNIGPGAKR